MSHSSSSLPNLHSSPGQRPARPPTFSKGSPGQLPPLLSSPYLPVTGFKYRRTHQRRGILKTNCFQFTLNKLYLKKFSVCPCRKPAGEGPPGRAQCSVPGVPREHGRVELVGRSNAGPSGRPLRSGQNTFWPGFQLTFRSTQP